MTLHTLDRPDEMPALAHWLERQLVGDTLGAVVAELSAALPEKPTVVPTLSELLDDQPQAVLQRGLVAVSEQNLRRLFRSPTRLLELQELVLIDGGDYWERVERPASVASSFERVRNRLHIELSSSATIASSHQPPSAASSSRRNWLVVAAALFLGAIGLGWFVPRGGGAAEMAWTKSETYRNPDQPSVLLTRLEDSAADWRQRAGKATSAKELASHIRQFRRGCDELLKHEPELTANGLDWLVQDCRKWAGKFDQHLADLDRGQRLATVQSEVDTTVKKLIKKIHDHV